MNDQELPEIAEETTVNVQGEQDNSLLTRLENWVNERKGKPAEERVRRMITEDVQADIRRKKMRILPSPEEILRRARVDINRISRDGRVEITTEERTDSKVPTERYRVKLLVTDIGWVAQEVNPDGDVYTEAVINRDGTTSLTLRAGPRYDSLNANPRIEQADSYPSATMRTFHFLVGSILPPSITERISQVFRRT